MEIDFFKLCFCILTLAAVAETVEKVKPWFTLFILVSMSCWSWTYFIGLMIDVIKKVHNI